MKGNLMHIRDNIDGVSQEELKERLIYDPETGIFTWKEADKKHFASEASCKKWNDARAGKIAGHIDISGWCVISMKRRRYMAHRLAHRYMTGSFPEGLVSHKNGKRSDNRWENIS